MKTELFDYVVNHFLYNDQLVSRLPVDEIINEIDEVSLKNDKLYKMWNNFGYDEQRSFADEVKGIMIDTINLKAEIDSGNY